MTSTTFSIVPADDPAPSGARPSAGTMLTSANTNLITTSLLRQTDLTMTLRCRRYRHWSHLVGHCLTSLPEPGRASGYQVREAGVHGLPVPAPGRPQVPPHQAAGRGAVVARSWPFVAIEGALPGWGVSICQGPGRAERQEGACRGRTL